MRLPKWMLNSRSSAMRTVIWLKAMNARMPSIAVLLATLMGCPNSNVAKSALPSKTVANTESKMSSSIKILGERDTGNGVEQKFAFIEGQTEKAVEYLIQVLDTAEISLMNNADEGGEGVTTFRKTENGFERMDGGHGWQSEWKIMGHDQIRDRMLELVPSNMGGHWSTEGSITRRNAK
ncbi:hypothetical protein [Allorhodopirellula heiligendammensis]|uniref:hypothetical protein n=1 Tax=Allorhodopirellula heiligendammensis TaxID=2714739 RepID=UPI00265EB085|nr:hypothetical protein [Allorhodopirellula heiligendammensis]